MKRCGRTPPRDAARDHTVPWEVALQVPAQVEYEKATSVEDALSRLARHGPVARILAGGHSLIPMMKLRLAQPEVLIDINPITSLRYITLDGGTLRIGALTRHADLLASPVAGELFPLLHDAERVIADPIVRNWGTIGGSLCQADPSEDLSAAFATMKGSMIIRGLDGTRSDTGRDTTREVSARAFHTGPYETVVGPAEMLTEIRLPIKSGGGSAYLKVSRRAGDWPVGAVGAAVWLSRANSRKHHVIEDVGIGLTALGATHFVAVEARNSSAASPRITKPSNERARSRHATAAPSPTSVARPTTSATSPRNSRPGPCARPSTGP